LQDPAARQGSVDPQTTVVAGVQTPSTQASSSVQASPSLQAVPSARFGFEQAPVSGLQTPAEWQASRALQTTGLVPTHAPARQASDRVHRFPSSHWAPSSLTGFVHVPVSGLQVPAWWQLSSAAQTTGRAPEQVPPTHRSTVVQAFPSSHGVLSGFAGREHAPGVGSQVPASWQASPAVQTTGLAPTQDPPWQLSDRVQASPSLQGMPSSRARWVQTPAWHTSSVQAFVSAEHDVPSGWLTTRQVPSPLQRVDTWHSVGAGHWYRVPVHCPLPQLSP
jgi:hypothetical protein